MTIIGAPQCRQMKTGWVATTVSCDDGLTSGATCRRSRTFARLARRTRLASSSDAMEATGQHPGSGVSSPATLARGGGRCPQPPA